MIPTLNAMGHMFAHTDPFTQDFITYAIAHCQRVADIGPAFGIASLPVVNAGVETTVIDLDQGHLDYIQSHTAPDMRKFLHSYVGHFPQTVTLPLNTFGAIIVSRILHFFDVDSMVFALAHLYDALLPGGRLYFISTTPFIKIYESFIPVYLARRSNQVQWPGVMNNIHEYAPHRAHQLPSYINLMDLPEAKSLLTRLDFKIIRSGYIPSPHGQFDISLDGREHIGIVAEKPRIQQKNNF